MTKHLGPPMLLVGVLATVSCDDIPLDAVYRSEEGGAPNSLGGSRPGESGGSAGLGGGGKDGSGGGTSGPVSPEECNVAPGKNGALLTSAWDCSSAPIENRSCYFRASCLDGAGATAQAKNGNELTFSGTCVGVRLFIELNARNDVTAGPLCQDMTAYDGFELKLKGSMPTLDVRLAHNLHSTPDPSPYPTLLGPKATVPVTKDVARWVSLRWSDFLPGEGEIDGPRAAESLFGIELTSSYAPIELKIEQMQFFVGDGEQATP